MNTWKAILAMGVIFAAGVITGGVLVNRVAPARAPLAPAPYWRFEMMRRMVADLDLMPEQRARIERHMHETKLRVQEIMEILGPDLSAETLRLKNKISEELRPEQRRRFEQLLRETPRRPGNKLPPKGQYSDYPPREMMPPPDARPFKPLPPRDGNPEGPVVPRRPPPEGRRPNQPSSSER